jgi:RNase P subunit RPR2
MRELTMINGHIHEPPKLRLECVDCDERTRFHSKPDDPYTVVRCQQCGTKHSRNSLIDVNAAGVNDE